MGRKTCVMDYWPESWNKDHRKVPFAIGGGDAFSSDGRAIFACVASTWDRARASRHIGLAAGSGRGAELDRWKTPRAIPRGGGGFGTGPSPPAWGTSASAWSGGAGLARPLKSSGWPRLPGRASPNWCSLPCIAATAGCTGNSRSSHRRPLPSQYPRQCDGADPRCQKRLGVGVKPVAGGCGCGRGSRSIRGGGGGQRLAIAYWSSEQKDWVPGTDAPCSNHGWGQPLRPQWVKGGIPAPTIRLHRTVRGGCSHRRDHRCTRLSHMTLPRIRKH
eukprot:scaffold1017_cov374-Prasinococcus_capsulatus_cf.AAC.4